jgi:hypothetical protein
VQEIDAAFWRVTVTNPDRPRRFRHEKETVASQRRLGGSRPPLPARMVRETKERTGRPRRTAEKRPRRSARGRRLLGGRRAAARSGRLAVRQDTHGARRFPRRNRLAPGRAAGTRTQRRKNNGVGDLAGRVAERTSFACRTGRDGTAWY